MSQYEPAEPIQVKEGIASLPAEIDVQAQRLRECLHELSNVFTALRMQEERTGACLDGATRNALHSVRSALRDGEGLLDALHQSLQTHLSSPESKDMPVNGAGLHQGLTILLADDHRGARDSLEALLASWGCTVFTAGGAEEAEMLFRRKRPQLAIVDAGLEGELGLGLSLRMRRIQPECRILLISGKEISPEAVAIADLALEKPIGPKELKAGLLALFPD